MTWVTSSWCVRCRCHNLRLSGLQVYDFAAIFEGASRKETSSCDVDSVLLSADGFDYTVSLRLVRLLLAVVSPLILFKLVVPILFTGTHGCDHGREEEDCGYNSCTYYAGLEEMVELVPADIGHLDGGWTRSLDSREEVSGCAS